MIVLRQTTIRLSSSYPVSRDYINFFLTFLGDNLPTYLSQIATARLHLYVDLYGSSLEY